jgi:hypothetical protein
LKIVFYKAMLIETTGILYQIMYASPHKTRKYKKRDPAHAGSLSKTVGKPIT